MRRFESVHDNSLKTMLVYKIQDVLFMEVCLIICYKKRWTTKFRRCRTIVKVFGTAKNSTTTDNIAKV